MWIIFILFKVLLPKYLYIKEFISSDPWLPPCTPIIISLLVIDFLF